MILHDIADSANIAPEMLSFHKNAAGLTDNSEKISTFASGMLKYSQLSV
jgi:hypothetical protein